MHSIHHSSSSSPGSARPALLQAHGIAVVADAPGVGNDLNDHLSGRIILHCKEPITLNDTVRTWGGKLSHGSHYLLTRRGYLAVPAVSAGCFLRAHPASATADSQCSISLFSAQTIGGELHPFPGVTGNCVLLRPESRGYVRIKSADPREVPAIHPNYLATQTDRETIVAGVAAMRRIFQAPAMARHIAEEIEPARNATTTTNCSISSATAAPPPIIRWALAAWARTPRPWSTNGCACAVLLGCALLTPRSCQRSFPAIPTQPRS